MDIQGKLHQKAVYWAPGSMNEFGILSFATAIELDCRWDDKASVILNQEGENINSTSQIISLTDMAVRGWLFEGELTDLPSDYSDPRMVDGAKEIARFDVIPSLSDPDTQVKIAYL